MADFRINQTNTHTTSGRWKHTLSPTWREEAGDDSYWTARSPKCCVNKDYSGKKRINGVRAIAGRKGFLRGLMSILKFNNTTCVINYGLSQSSGRLIQQDLQGMKKIDTHTCTQKLSEIAIYQLQLNNFPEVAELLLSASREFHLLRLEANFSTFNQCATVKMMLQSRFATYCIPLLQVKGPIL